MSDANDKKARVPAGPIPYRFRALGLGDWTLEGATIRVVTGSLGSFDDMLRFEGIVSYDDGGKKMNRIIITIGTDNFEDKEADVVYTLRTLANRLEVNGLFAFEEFRLYDRNGNRIGMVTQEESEDNDV